MELLQELGRDIREIEKQENLEIYRIIVNKDGNRELSRYISPDFDNHDTIYGYDVVNFPCEDKYKIITEELYKKCDGCDQKKMYDEKYEKYYCPMCDSRISRFKDKLYKIVD